MKKSITCPNCDEVFKNVQDFEYHAMRIHPILIEKLVNASDEIRLKEGRPNICGECGVLEGQIHVYGCEMERCHLCGGQLISCDCGKKKSEEKKRIPYIVYPNLCRRCGKKWPAMFRVPDEEWIHYIEPDQRHEMLCRKCYDEIKKLIDAGAKVEARFDPNAPLVKGIIAFMKKQERIAK